MITSLVQVILTLEGNKLFMCIHTHVHKKYTYKCMYFCVCGYSNTLYIITLHIILYMLTCMCACMQTEHTSFVTFSHVRPIRNTLFSLNTSLSSTRTANTMLIPYSTTVSWKHNGKSTYRAYIQGISVQVQSTHSTVTEHTYIHVTHTHIPHIGIKSHP